VGCGVSDLEFYARGHEETPSGGGFVGQGWDWVLGTSAVKTNSQPRVD